MRRKIPKILASTLAALFLVVVIEATVVRPANAYAADVGVVDLQLVLSKYPNIQKINEAFQAEVDQAKKEFEAKASGLSDKDKQDLNNQLGQRVAKKRQELLEPVFAKINAAVKAVADAKGLTVVVGKPVVVYGGQDITNDVVAKITGG